MAHEYKGWDCEAPNVHTRWKSKLPKKRRGACMQGCSMKSEPRLRFGLMCNGHELMAWQAECVKLLLESNLADLKLVIAPDVSGRPPTSRWTQISADPNGLAFKIFERLTAKASRAKRTVDMKKELERADYLRCRTFFKGKFSQHFSDEDIARVRNYDLDFILRFGFNIIRGEILNSARYGIWSFHHDDERKYRGGPPGLWEIYHNDPQTGAILQRLTDKLDGGIVLYRGMFPTVAWSWRLNCDQTMFGCADWPLRVCRDILNDCAGYVCGEPSPTKAPIYFRPTTWQTMRLAARTTVNFVRRQLKELILREQWHVGIVREPIHTFVESGGRAKVKWLPNLPRTRFIADPFARKRGSEITILVEDFDQIRGKGCISEVHSTDDGRSFSSPTPVSGGIFDDPIHKAYPYLFEHVGEIFCVPETSEKNEIVLHRAIQFPEKWERVRVLLAGIAAVDPTLFSHEGYWWMYYTDRDRGSNVKLYLASAPQLEGPWSLHPANPIKTDISGARPGGTPYVHQGVLYRPAQDSTRTYGGELVIYRVNKLTRTEYKEEAVCRLSPQRNGRYSQALHTLAAAGDLTIVDGKRYVAIPQLLPIMLKKKILSVLRSWSDPPPAAPKRTGFPVTY